MRIERVGWGLLKNGRCMIHLGRCRIPVMTNSSPINGDIIS